jgi:hypothetical protein
MANKNPKNVKMKSLLEGFAWERSERQFGKPLPTLEDIQKAYEAKQDIKEDNTTSRMEGLLDQNAWKQAVAKLEGIVEFYQNEGFENDEIVDFLTEKLEEFMIDMM